MDFLWDKITEWLKEMLVSGVISNLTGLFDATNQKVGEIAGQVAMTPQAWNASVFGMIQNLSNSVIVPIAGAILAFVMTLELIQLITDKNNLNDVDTWMFFKWAFKSATAVLIVTNTWNIVMGIHNNLRINTHLMWQMMNQALPHRSAEYADNRLSLFSAQWGKCAITGQPFEGLDDIHCHHKKPRHMGGTDKYENLILVQKQVHRLIHATSNDTIQHYLTLLNLSAEQVRKLNQLRLLAGCNEI